MNDKQKRYSNSESLANLFRQATSSTDRYEVFSMTNNTIELFLRTIRSLLTAKSALSNQSNIGSYYEMSVFSRFSSRFNFELSELRAKMLDILREFHAGLEYNSPWQKPILECMDGMETFAHADWFKENCITELSDITNMVWISNGLNETKLNRSESGFPRSFGSSINQNKEVMIEGNNDSTRFVNILPDDHSNRNLLLKIVIDKNNEENKGNGKNVQIPFNSDFTSYTKIDKVENKQLILMNADRSESTKRNPNRAAIYLKKSLLKNSGDISQRDPLSEFLKTSVIEQKKPEEDPQIKMLSEQRKRTNNRFSPLKKVEPGTSIKSTVESPEDIGLILPRAEKSKSSKYNIMEQKVYGEEEIKRKRVD